MADLSPYWGYAGTAIMGGLYLWRFLNEGKDKLSKDTETRYENAIKSFELESRQQKEENLRLNNRIKELTAKIEALEGVITARAEIQEVKTLVQRFEFIIPMMAQFAKNDEVTHNLLNQLLSGQREARTMIQDDFKATNRVERRMLETPSESDGSGDQANVSVSIKKRKA